jgi:hypothetical protein
VLLLTDDDELLLTPGMQARLSLLREPARRRLLPGGGGC